MESNERLHQGATWAKGYACCADFEILTLLFQRVGQPGLEVCPGKGVSPQTVKAQGKWIPVDPKEGCITCALPPTPSPLSSGVSLIYYHSGNRASCGDRGYDSFIALWKGFIYIYI